MGGVKKEELRGEEGRKVNTCLEDSISSSLPLDWIGLRITVSIVDHLCLSSSPQTNTHHHLARLFILPPLHKFQTPPQVVHHYTTAKMTIAFSGPHAFEFFGFTPKATVVLQANPLFLAVLVVILVVMGLIIGLAVFIHFRTNKPYYKPKPKKGGK